MAETGHEPHFVLKPAAPEVWIADGPHMPMGRIPIPVRMTAVRLPDGGMWLHSPIQAKPELVAQVRALGPIRHLVAPNEAHFSWVKDWTLEAPEAAAWGAPGVPDRARRQSKGVDWAGELSEVPPPDWGGAISLLLVRGSRLHKEVAFLHGASRTLILTDLIVNLKPEGLPVWLGPLARLGGVADPDGKAPPYLRATYTDRRALRECVERMIAWAPERIIVSHGRWYASDGTAELRRAFRWVLR